MTDTDKQPTVLIADDDMISIEVLKAMLGAFPVRLLTANDGNEAVQLATAEHPDLCIFDYDMPGMTGAEACKSLRAIGGFDSMPVIALTGHQSVNELNACQQAGMNATLHKPVSPDALKDVLADYLQL